MDAPTLILVGLLTFIVLVGVVDSAASSGARRRRAEASLSAIDFARGSFASQLSHGVPMADLLLQLVESLRSTFKLEAAQLWLLADGRLAVVAAEPHVERPPIAVSLVEQSIATDTGVCGAAWARTWLPELLDGRLDPNVRVAPITYAGQLFGLIVASRSRRGNRLGPEADTTLEEVAREVGVAVNKARLDEALQQSIEQLRRQALELQASRARLVAAADEERRRIERNLHDGAQQHLIAIAINARLIEQLAGKDADRASHLLGQLQQDATAGLDELRALAHGIYPPLLSSAGLGDAVSAACRRAALSATVEVDGVGRYPREIESAVYFCCLEALQNAGKYAGEGASARVRVWKDDGNLWFEVADDGAGFDASASARGAGLTNMRDRLGAVGGAIIIESAPGGGTSVQGVVPVNEPA